MRCVLLFAIAVLISAAPAHAEEESGSSVEVQFITFHGHKRKIEVPLSEKQAERLQFFPREHQAVIDEAKRLYAEKLGFSRKVYGLDCWKIIPGLRVDYADLNMADGTTVELR